MRFKFKFNLKGQMTEFERNVAEGNIGLHQSRKEMEMEQFE